MLNPPHNPFIYGKPVPIGRFIGRQREVSQVFSRLYNGESTAIVGEPHIGKTSLLKYIADEEHAPRVDQPVFAQYAFVDFDCQPLGPTAARRLLAAGVGPVTEQIEDEAVRWQCQVVAQSDYKRFRAGECVPADRPARVPSSVAHRRVRHDAGPSAFGQAEFLAALRSLATRTDGLALITASRSR